MSQPTPQDNTPSAASRRQFLKNLSQGAVAGGTTGGLLGSAGQGVAAGTGTGSGKVGMRTLGKTDLKISEIGFGGHSWAYRRVPDGKGDFRVPTIDEAVEMIAAGLDMGVNFLDSCTALLESSTPGEALKRLKARDKVILSIRVSHKMNGVKEDREEIYKWTEERLKLWQTDCVDLCLLCNSENDTPESGYWDMSYSIEALEKLKEQGKIRYTGFGCHFTPELFFKAIDKFGDYFDICSIPYNIRHRAADMATPDVLYNIPRRAANTVLQAAKKKNMGTITIKPFARGSLLKNRDLEGADRGLARDMIAFVLENEAVDCCTCGVHTLAHVKENFSASWTKIAPADRGRLEIAAATPCEEHRWLEDGWLHA